MSRTVKWRDEDGGQPRDRVPDPWSAPARRGSVSTGRVIALFGLFGVGNIGNEASLSSAVHAARCLEPGVELVCVCPAPDVVEREHGIAAVPIQMSGPLPDGPRGSRPLRIMQRPVFELARWVAAYRFLRRVDQVIVPGTGILDDFGCGPREMPYQLFRWSLICKLARKPFTFLSVGAGPITHPASRFLMKSAVQLSSHCSYRDEFSCAYMAGIGASAADNPVRPDVVFALPRPEERPRAAGITIGLGLMAYRGWANDPAAGEDIFRRYIENMSTIACRILDTEACIRVLIGEKGDERAVDALLAEIRLRRGAAVDARQVIVEPIESMADLLSQIAGTDAVVATRYHNVVGALMMNRPVVSLGYATKFNDVMSSFGLGGYCHDVEAFDPESVLGDLDELRGKWSEFLPVVADRNGETIEELTREFGAVMTGAGRPASVISGQCG